MNDERENGREWRTRCRLQALAPPRRDSGVHFCCQLSLYKDCAVEYDDMPLSLIGLGLWKLNDLTVEGLEQIKATDQIWLENYTSIVGYTVQELETVIGKKVRLADRSVMEEKADILLDAAAKSDVVVLVAGDPLSATTHVELILEAQKRNIPVRIVHNASVLTAVAQTGLFLYKFGKTTSIPFQAREQSEKVETPARILKENQSIHAHTLLLLDLNPEKQDFLTIPQAIAYLLAKQAIAEDTRCIGCSRLGADDVKLVYGSAATLKTVDFGKPPYALVVPAKELHFKEQEALERFAV